MFEYSRDINYAVHYPQSLDVAFLACLEDVGFTVSRVMYKPVEVGVLGIQSSLADSMKHIKVDVKPISASEYANASRNMSGSAS